MSESTSTAAPPRGHRRREAGYALLIVVLITTIMIIGTTVAVKVWSTVIQRDREEELIFRGKQYSQAILLYRKVRGTLPSDLKQLSEKGTKGESILRQPYKDPITGGDFGLVFAGPNGTPIPDEPIEGGLDEEDDAGPPGGVNPAASNVPPGGAGAINTGFAGSSPRGAGAGPDRSAFGVPTGAPGGMGIMGVHSKSRAEAIGPARWHDLDRYNQWLFLIGDTGVGGQPARPVVPGQPPPPPH